MNSNRENNFVNEIFQKISRLLITPRILVNWSCLGNRGVFFSLVKLVSFPTVRSKALQFYRL